MVSQPNRHVSGSVIFEELKRRIVRSEYHMKKKLQTISIR